MSNSDSEYYRTRALDARQRAASATHPASVDAHSEMAARYDWLASQSEEPDGLAD